MVPSREVFPNAPLAMVVAETRFSYCPELVDQSSMVSALALVREFVPVMQVEQQQVVEFQVANDQAPSTSHQTTSVMGARALDGQTTVALTPQTLTVAMSGVAYSKFEDSLRRVMEAAATGLAGAVSNLIVTRAGLRYLDEIRVPEPPANMSGWSRWVDPGLLGAADYLPEPVASGMRSTWQYVLTGDRQITFNYGPFVGTGVVGPGHPFHKAGRDSTMFVLDLDCAWTPPSGAAPLTSADLLARYDELHAPAQEVFARSITDEARTLFRGKADT